MEFEDTPEEAAFREECRAFLSQHASLKERGRQRLTMSSLAADEDITAALARELDEECGAQLRRAGEEIVTVIERHPAIERPGAVFEMISPTASGSSSSTPTVSSRPSM